MKLSYTSEEVERWRDKVHRRTPKLAVKNDRDALVFINSVGFCLASKADGMELPNLWDAITSRQLPPENGRAKRNYYLSYAWEIQGILPNHNSIYYGKIFRRRPSIVSREFFSCFYAMSERTGVAGEYKREYAGGKLSAMAYSIMNILSKSSSMTSKELRATLAGENHYQEFEKALEELQRKMFVARIVGNGNKFAAEWALVTKLFPAEVRKARRMSKDTARHVLLQKYFENQLISSIENLHRVFAWPKKDIYRTIGQLIHSGVITPLVAIDGIRGKYYSLVR